MLFRRVDIPGAPGYKGPSWYMIVQTSEELAKYNDVDTELFGQALMNLPQNLEKSHLSGARERGIKMALDTAAFKGERISPIVVTAQLSNQKHNAMQKVLDMGESLLIRENGSYCGYESFMRIWEKAGANVIEEYRSTGLGFPRDGVKPVDLVFLENAERLDIDFEYDVRRLMDLDKKSFIKVENLKCVDTGWLVKQLRECKTIAFYTQFANPAQTEQMVQMFMLMDRKQFIVRSNWREDIEKQKWYASFVEKHEVIWI